MAAGLETRSNSTNGSKSDISKEIQELEPRFRKPKKPLDLIKVQAEQHGLEKHKELKKLRENEELKKRLNQINEHKDNVRQFSHLIEKIYLSSKNVANKIYDGEIKELEEEKKEIEKKLEQEELKSQDKNDQKQELQDCKKKTDGEVAESGKNEKQELRERKKVINKRIEEISKIKEELAKKIAEQMLNQHKTSDVIEKTQKLMREQFRMNCAVQSIAWLYNSMFQVDQAFADFMKTAFKLLLEQKI